jgi:hypothetical protein
MPSLDYVIFMHENVRTLTVQFFDPFGDPIDGNAIESYMRDITARMPKIRELDLDLLAPTHLYEEAITTMLSELPHLEVVRLSPFSMTSNVVSQLSALPCLRVAEYHMHIHPRQANKSSVANFAPKLDVGAFESMRDLSLCASLSDVSRFLSMEHAPTRLTHLFIQCPNDFETEPSTRAFITFVSHSLPTIVGLYLELRDGEHSVPGDEADARITLDTLRPLHALPDLRIFELYHELPLQMSEVELEDFVKELPRLTGLELNCEPFYPDPSPSLSLSALYIIAQHCPEISHLGLFMSLGKLERRDSPTTPSSLSRLQCLNLGSSAIAHGDDDDLVFWLSNILPPTCTVLVGFTWERAFPSDVVILPYAGSIQNHINRILPLVSEVYPPRDVHPLSDVAKLSLARAEERAKNQALERQVEDLKVRNEVLRDSALMRIGGVPI